MTPTEFRMWEVYLVERPPNVAEIQMAMLLRTISSIFGGKSEIDDFILSEAYKPKKKEDKKIEGPALEQALKMMFT